MNPLTPEQRDALTWRAPATKQIDTWAEDFLERIRRERQLVMENTTTGPDEQSDEIIKKETAE